MICVTFVYFLSGKIQTTQLSMKMYSTINLWPPTSGESTTTGIKLDSEQTAALQITPSLLLDTVSTGETRSSSRVKRSSTNILSSSSAPLSKTTTKVEPSSGKQTNEKISLAPNTADSRTGTISTDDRTISSLESISQETQKLEILNTTAKPHHVTTESVIRNLTSTSTSPLSIQDPSPSLDVTFNGHSTTSDKLSTNTKAFDESNTTKNNGNFSDYIDVTLFSPGTTSALTQEENKNPLFSSQLTTDASFTTKQQNDIQGESSTDSENISFAVTSFLSPLHSDSTSSSLELYTGISSDGTFSLLPSTSWLSTLAPVITSAADVTTQKVSDIESQSVRSQLITDSIFTVSSENHIPSQRDPSWSTQISFQTLVFSDYLAQNTFSTEILEPTSIAFSPTPYSESQIQTSLWIASSDTTTVHTSATDFVTSVMDLTFNTDTSRSTEVLLSSESLEKLLSTSWDEMSKSEDVSSVMLQSGSDTTGSDAILATGGMSKSYSNVSSTASLIPGQRYHGIIKVTSGAQWQNELSSKNSEQYKILESKMLKFVSI